MDILRRTDILTRMLLLSLVACGDAEVDGAFALGFDGEPDCVETEVTGEVPSTLTVEAWVRGDPAPSSQTRPVANLGGVFGLEESREGFVSFSVGDSDGAVYAFTVMDGVLHHLAGVFDDGTATLFVDGERVAFADAGLANQSVTTLRIGCTGTGEGFEGLIDELRISSVARYTETFTRSVEPFDADEDTWLLFHFDEGHGEVATDLVSGGEALLEGVEWVPFELTEGQAG